MKTILDSGHSWFLEQLKYDDSDRLEIIIVEGIRAKHPSKIEIAGTDLGEGYSIDVTGDSRYFLLVFENVLAYQVTYESYTYGDEYEIKSKGVLGKYKRSRYLDYIREWTLIDKIIEDDYSHFGLFLEDHIIDVIVLQDPIIEKIDNHLNGNRNYL